jgi:hypothetical protein
MMSSLANIAGVASPGAQPCPLITDTLLLVAS